MLISAEDAYFLQGTTISRTVSHRSATSTSIQKTVAGAALGASKAPLMCANAQGCLFFDPPDDITAQERAGLGWLLTSDFKSGQQDPSTSHPKELVDENCSWEGEQLVRLYSCSTVAAQPPLQSSPAAFSHSHHLTRFSCGRGLWY